MKSDKNNPYFKLGVQLEKTRRAEELAERLGRHLERKNKRLDRALHLIDALSRLVEDNGTEFPPEVEKMFNDLDEVDV